MPLWLAKETGLTGTPIILAKLSFVTELSAFRYTTQGFVFCKQDGTLDDVL